MHAKPEYTVKGFQHPMQFNVLSTAQGHPWMDKEGELVC